MERQSKGSRGLEAYCKGGQGSPQAVAPSKKKKKIYLELKKLKHIPGVFEILAVFQNLYLFIVQFLAETLANFCRTKEH